MSQKIYMRMSKAEHQIFDQFVKAVNDSMRQEHAAKIAADGVQSKEKPYSLMFSGISHEDVARKIVMGYVMKQVETIDGKPVGAVGGEDVQSAEAVTTESTAEQSQSGPSDTHALPDTQTDSHSS